jgi:plastocyanin
MKQKKLILLIAVTLFGGLTLPAATNVVLIGNYFFNPTNLTINAGDTVLWTNTAAAASPSIAHDSTSTNLAFIWGSGPLTSTNRTFSLTFSNVGTFPYICATHVLAFNPSQRHPEQTGTLFVVSANLPTNSILTEPARSPDGQFRFTIQGVAGQTYTTEVSSNLTDWSAILTNVAPANTFNVTDSTAPGVLLRFYRARQDL